MATKTHNFHLRELANVGTCHLSDTVRTRRMGALPTARRSPGASNLPLLGSMRYHNEIRVFSGLATDALLETARSGLFCQLTVRWYSTSVSSLWSLNNGITTRKATRIGQRPIHVGQMLTQSGTNFRSSSMSYAARCRFLAAEMSIVGRAPYRAAARASLIKSANARMIERFHWASGRQLRQAPRTIAEEGLKDI